MKSLVATFATRRATAFILCLVALALSFGAFAAASSSSSNRATNDSVARQQAARTVSRAQPRALANAGLIGPVRKAVLPDSGLAAFDFFKLNEMAMMFATPTLSYNIQPGNTTQLRVLTVGDNATINPTAGPADATSITVLPGGCYTGGIAVNSTNGIVQLFNAARQTPATGQTCTITIRATNTMGMMTTMVDASFNVQVNYPPTFTVQGGITRTAGTPVAPGSNTKIIDNLDDDYTTNPNLIVTVNGNPNATVNDVTVSNITINGNMVFADIQAGCNATTANFTLAVSEPGLGGLTTSKNLTVTVSPNTAPVLSYQTPAQMMNPPLINEGGTPPPFNTLTGPTDNNLPLQSLMITSLGGFTGGATIQNNPANANYGQVTLSNAGPGGGTITLTVTAVDNCGVSTAAQIKVKINARPSVAALGLGIRQGGTLTNVQIATVSDPEDGIPTGMPPISLTPLTNGGVTFSNVMLNTTTGAVTANITAACNAPTSPDALFTLTAKDSNGSTSLATNNIVVNVEANEPPVLSYAPTVTVSAGTNTTISPTSGPSDSGGLTSVSLITPAATACGMLALNSAPLTGNANLGKIMLTGVPGTSQTCTVTVRAIDTCNAMIDATFQIRITAPMVGITKTHTQPDVMPGEVAVFQLNYSNTGDQDAAGVVLTDVVPANTTFEAASSSGGWSCANGAPAGTTCTYNVGNIGIGNTITTILFGVRVVNPIASGVAQISNQFAFSATGIGGQSSNVDMIPITAFPDVAVTKTDNGITSGPGQTILYNVGYSNVGRRNALGVVVTETVPANTTFNATLSTAGWSCANNAPAGTVCTRTVGALAGGAAGMANFVVNVVNPLPAGVTTVTNTVSISESSGVDPNDPVTSNNTAIDTTPVGTGPQITPIVVGITAGSPPVNVKIATVTDDLSPANTITVVQTSGQPNILFNNITNQNGMIFADVSALCSVAGGNYLVGLQATDAGQRIVTANTVNNVVVTANTAPVLGTYPATGPVNLAGNTTASPSAAPSDNGTISTLVATSGTFTGSLSVSPTGVVNISNAGPAGVHTITVTATDNCGLAANRTFQLTVNGPPTITPAVALSLQQGTAAVNAPVATVGDDLTPAGSLTVVKTFAAPGIVVTGVTNTGGAVTANIAADCTANLGANIVTFQVTDGGGLSSSANFTVNVTANTAPTLGTYAPTNVNAGTNVTVTPSAAPTDNGMVASLTAVSSPGFTGTLSTNIATGAVTITNAGPVGPFTITVTATDNCGAQTSTTFALNVTCPTITVNLPSGTVGTVGTQLGPNASFTFTQTGGVGNINYLISTGTLPAGITLGANGLLSGTPSQQGSFPITVQATDANGCTGISATYTLVINCQNITVSSPATTTGTVGAPFTATFTQVGGIGTPINFTLNSGSLPAGLVLNLNGTLSGTPTQNGSFTFTVKATDANGCTGVSPSYTLVISCPTITVSPASLPSGTYGVGYNQTISATPAGTYSYTVTTGSLPPGLSLNATTGVLNGTPTQVGTFNFTVTANYYGSCLQTKTYSIVINCPPITFEPPNLQPGTIGSPYTQTVVASPLTGYTYSISLGSLPPGVTLNPATGEISGTPTLIGTFNFTVTATGSGALATCSGSKAYTIIINCRVVTVTPPTGLPGGTVGGAYSQTVSATPAGTYTFSQPFGNLPPGVTLNPTTGVISGTPTTAGTYNFTIRATDPDTCSGTQAYQVIITCPVIVISPTSLPTGTMGVTYLTTNLSASPAGGNYTFALTSGSLPNGITLTSAGVLSGAPTVAGSFPITITVTNGFQCSQSISYTLVVNQCPPITVDPVTIAEGASGTLYTQSFSATGGVASYTFAKNGTLPNGLTLSSAGVLSGTPTLTGDFPITVIATDANGCTGSRAYTLRIAVGCTFGIAPSGQGFSFFGGNGTVAVTANSGCQWTAFTGDAWITVTSGASGSGNGTVGYSVAINNTGVARTGTLTVASQTFTITQAANTGGLQYYPLAQPVRLLDTRPQPQFDGCVPSVTPLGAMSTTTLPAISSCTGIPANAQAIVGNATVVSSQNAGGFITLFPTGAPLPNASNLNYSPGQVVPNAFTVGLDGTGNFNTYASGATDLIVDVTGYYAPPSPTGLYFHPLAAPVRLLDTRPNPFTSCIASITPLVGSSTTTLSALGACTGIPSGAKAIVGNATAVNTQSGGGYLTLFPSGAVPNASNLNYGPNQTVPNAFTVGLDGAGNFRVYASATTDLVIDVSGYYSTEAVDANGEGLLFYPLSSPGRWLDTRPDPAFPSCVAAGSPLGNASTTTLTAQLTCGALTIPASARAVLGNATVVSTQGAGGYITLFPTGAPLPNASNLNYSPGQVVPNAFAVGLGAGGAFNISASGATDFIVDLSAYFSL